MTTVRPATCEDVPFVHDLDRRCSRVFSSPDSYANLLSAQSGLLLIGDLDGNSCGFAAASWVVDEATLLNLVVKPDKAGRGIGRFLLDGMIGRLAGLKLQKLFLEVRASNSAAIALYTSQGFSCDGRRAAYYSVKSGPVKTGPVKTGPAQTGSEAGAKREDAILMSFDLGSVHASA